MPPAMGRPSIMPWLGPNFGAGVCRYTPRQSRGKPFDLRLKFVEIGDQTHPPLAADHLGRFPLEGDKPSQTSEINIEYTA